METVEILAGAEFSNAVKALGLASAKCTYHYQPKPDSCRSLCAVEDDDWKENWGWWRHALGSNMGPVYSEYVINSKKIVAWDGVRRVCYFEDFCRDCSDYATGVCSGAEGDRLDCYHGREYEDLFRYFCDEIGASTERNVCALAIDLARQNNMTLVELLKNYLG